jgi:hypothetical protein
MLVFRLNTTSGLAELQLQTLVVQPRDGHIDFVVVGGQEQGVVGTLVKAHPNDLIAEGDLGGSIDEIPKEVARGGPLIALTDGVTQSAVEATGHQGQLQITVDLHGHDRGERIPGEEVNALRDPVFDQPAVSVASDQLSRPPPALIGQ